MSLRINPYPILTLVSYLMVGQTDDSTASETAVADSSSDTVVISEEAEQPAIQPKATKRSAPAQVKENPPAPASVDTPKVQPQAEKTEAQNDGWALQEAGNGYILTLSEFAFTKVLYANNIPINKAEDLTWVDLVKAIAVNYGKNVNGNSADVAASIVNMAAILQQDNACARPIDVLRGLKMSFGEKIASIVHLKFTFNQYASYQNFVQTYREPRAIRGKLGSFPSEVPFKISGKFNDLLSELPDINSEPCQPAPEPVKPAKAAPAAVTNEVNETKVRVHVHKSAAEEEEEPAAGPGQVY